MKGGFEMPSMSGKGKKGGSNNNLVGGGDPIEDAQAKVNTARIASENDKNSDILTEALRVAELELADAVAAAQKADAVAAAQKADVVVPEAAADYTDVRVQKIGARDFTAVILDPSVIVPQTDAPTGGGKRRKRKTAAKKSKKSKKSKKGSTRKARKGRK